MDKEQIIIDGFLREINYSGIGDMNVSAEYDDMFHIEIESAHDVKHRKDDFYNVFTDYCQQYFSSIEWLNFLEGESVNFSSRYHEVVEEMDYDYHEGFLSNNLFVIKHDIQRDFQRYIDNNIDEIEEDYDEEEDEEEGNSLPLEMDADNYYFSITLKTTRVFPAEWLLVRFNEDRKLKFSKEARFHIEDYAERINLSKNDEENIYITDVRSDVGFLNIFCGLYSDNNLSSDLVDFIRNLYYSKDFERLVKGGMFGPKLDKIINKWNDLIYPKVLDSDTWFDFKLDVQRGLRKYAEELLKAGTINKDTWAEIYNAEIRFNLEYVDVIKEDALYYKVYKARRKANR